MGTLGARRRLILELTYFEGLTAEEIALKLNESVNVIRHDLYRGLAALRKAMAKQASATAAKESEREALKADAPAI